MGTSRLAGPRAARPRARAAHLARLTAALLVTGACASSIEPTGEGDGATGGAATGGASTGGAATGGASTGGAAIGGASTGGAATGGSTTGGASSGGASTGGAGTGGASTGGAGTGGSALCTGTCGFGCAALCGLGEPCDASNDCELAYTCSGDVCDTCGNEVQDGDEAGVDCGGTYCLGCAGDDCAIDADCVGELICETTCTTCGNGVQDGEETGLDCGEPVVCPLLCTGAACASDDACASGKCDTAGTGLCLAASCLEGYATEPSVEDCLENPQSDHLQRTDILDCLIVNADQCATFEACVSQNPNGSLPCDSEWNQVPSRTDALCVWNLLCP